METEYRFWIRERGRARNKWHVSETNIQSRDCMDGTRYVSDFTPCGRAFENISDDTHDTKELPNDTMPSDEHGVCRHCMRWTETENRKAERIARTPSESEFEAIISAMNKNMKRATMQTAR